MELLRLSYGTLSNILSFIVGIAVTTIALLAIAMKYTSKDKK